MRQFCWYRARAAAGHPLIVPSARRVRFASRVIAAERPGLWQTQRAHRSGGCGSAKWMVDVVVASGSAARPRRSLGPGHPARFGALAAGLAASLTVLAAIAGCGSSVTPISGQASTPLSGRVGVSGGGLSGSAGSASGAGVPVNPATGVTGSAGAAVTVAPADRAQASSTTALALLATIPVKGRAAKTGYSRAEFGAAWTDDNQDPLGHNGCDTRNDILRRDLTVVRIKAGSNGCTVLAGTLHDPYTGRSIAFSRGVGTSSAVQIDHVVALSNAWQTGAQYWAAAKRVDLANDPLNLLAVDGPSNEAKGDSDAATWLPPNKAYRCAYVARQVAVKARYSLWVTAAEHDAIARILAVCPGQKAPAETGAPPATHASTRAAPPKSSKPASTPTTRTSSRSAPPPAAKVYSNCAAMHADYPHGVGRPGAADHTSGKPVTTFTVNAALYDANRKLDRDGDGIACEAR
jgi:Excalibur calcium-binding domain./Domain of unknown function (DUF1994).